MFYFAYIHFKKYLCIYLTDTQCGLYFDFKVSIGAQRGT